MYDNIKKHPEIALELKKNNYGINKSKIYSLFFSLTKFNYTIFKLSKTCIELYGKESK